MKFYSGKKKNHTYKAQIIIDEKGKIISTYFSEGKKHDFSLFKDSIKKNKLSKDTCILADSGYLGINQFISKAILPFKGKNLSKDCKKFNQELSKKRVLVENVFRKIKVFKIFSNNYRNNIKQFSSDFNFIVGLVNLNAQI